MGDNLNTEVWRFVRVAGSTSNELITDLNNARSGLCRPVYDRHVILDAIDELVDEKDLRRDPGGRLFRTTESAIGLDHEAGGYISALEERLDNAWPRAGGRREIVRALAEEMQEVEDRSRELARMLYAVTVSLHRMYGNTSGPHGGIGGSAITMWCHYNDPYTEVDDTMVEAIKSTMGREIKRAEREGWSLNDE